MTVSMKRRLVSALPHSYAYVASLRCGATSEDMETRRLASPGRRSPVQNVRAAIDRGVTMSPVFLGAVARHLARRSAVLRLNSARMSGQVLLPEALFRPRSRHPTVIIAAILVAVPVGGCGAKGGEQVGRLPSTARLRVGSPKLPRATPTPSRTERHSPAGDPGVKESVVREYERATSLFRDGVYGPLVSRSGAHRALAQETEAYVRSVLSLVSQDLALISRRLEHVGNVSPELKADLAALRARVRSLTSRLARRHLDRTAVITTNLVAASIASQIAGL